LDGVNSLVVVDGVNTSEEVIKLKEENEKLDNII
jgi:hypothetical protein